MLEAIRRVPRELFVDANLRARAYEDVALPIGDGQAISQPLIVALTTHALNLKDTGRVLEVGTGSGYQAAFLAELADHVVTIERIPSLAAAASDRLQRFG